MSEDSDRRALLIVISAPSGAGKTTLCENVRAAIPSIQRAITCTTRGPRDSEEDGVDYYFLGEDEFLARVEGGEFLENAEVYGNRYGVLKSELRSKLAAGNDVLLNIDVQGAATVRKRAATDPVLNEALVTVFLCPPNLEELENRLCGRSSDSGDVIAERMDIAKDEIAQSHLFDYTLTSGTREEDLAEMLKIIESARRKSRDE
jgi:guanylate kinase